MIWNNSLHKKIAVIIPSPEFGGGSLSTSSKFADFFKEYSTFFLPTFFYLSFKDQQNQSFSEGRFSFSIKKTNIFSFDGIEIGAPIFSLESSLYKKRQAVWADLLQDFDFVLVVSPTILLAEPAICAGKKFVCYLATDVLQDRQDRLESSSCLEKLYFWLDRSALLEKEKMLLKSADKIICMSSYTKNRFLEIDPGLSAQDLQVVPFPFLNTNDAVAEKKYSSKIVLAIGRFSDPRKNLPMLLQVAKEVVEKDSQAIFVVIGSTAPDHFDKEGLRNLIFLPNASEDEKNFYLSIASVGVVTSYQEGFGIAAAEMMFAKTAVVSTRCGGCEDFVLPELLVSQNDSFSMSSLILNFLSNDSLCKELGIKSFDKVSSYCQQEKVFEAFLKVLQSVSN